MPGARAQPSASLEGTLVAAAPGSVGPFAQSVVLILGHDEDGAAGLVLNRPTSATLSDAVPELGNASEADYRLYSGGPVRSQQLSLLVRGDEGTGELREISPGVHYTLEAGAFDRVIESGPSADRLRVFAGYMRWEGGGLEAEIESGAWLITDGSADMIFGDENDDLWRRVIGRIQGDEESTDGRSAGSSTI